MPLLLTREKEIIFLPTPSYLKKIQQRSFWTNLNFLGHFSCLSGPLSTQLVSDHKGVQATSLVVILSGANTSVPLPAAVSQNQTWAPTPATRFLFLQTTNGWAYSAEKLITVSFWSKAALPAIPKSREDWKSLKARTGRTPLPGGERFTPRGPGTRFLCRPAPIPHKSTRQLALPLT